MDTKSVLKDALLLRPAERLQLIEMLARSLNKPDENIEKTIQRKTAEDRESWRRGGRDFPTSSL